MSDLVKRLRQGPWATTATGASTGATQLMCVSALDPHTVLLQKAADRIEALEEFVAKVRYWRCGRDRVKKMWEVDQALAELDKAAP